MSVLVLVEPGEELSLQALSLARDLGGPVHALAFEAAELGAYGVETVHVAEHDQLSSYAPGAWAAFLDQLIERTGDQGVGIQRKHYIARELITEAVARCGVPAFAREELLVDPADLGQV